MKITGRTNITGIFGDPVEQTLSPAMHNSAFEALGLDWVYLPFLVRSKPAGELKAAISGIKALGLKGVNITTPHKEKVIKLLDEVDLHAKEIGAVNTVVNVDGALTGYNTDGTGYLLSLREETGFTPQGKNIIIIGAGGASRAIVYAIIAGNPKRVVISNRTVKRGELLAQEFTKRFKGVEIKAIPLKKDAISAYASTSDLLVNTTTAGMMGKGELDLPVDSLPSHAVVSDIVYKPLETGLIKKAKARGLTAHGGLGMLVRQGAIAFELWTHKLAPLDVMRNAALEALG